MKYKTKFNSRRSEWQVYYDMANDYACVVYVSMYEGNADDEADRLNSIERLHDNSSTV